MEPRNYIEDSSHVMPHVFLPEDIYSKAMESLIVVVADVMFIDRAKKVMYLTTRKAKPMQGLWVMGGRLFAGEDQKVGIQRLLKRETSLEVSLDRFQFLCMNRYINAHRQQEPQDKGSDTLSYTFVLEASADEVETAAKNLDSREYDVSKGLQEYTLATLKELRGVHPALLDMAELVFGTS